MVKRCVDMHSKDHAFAAAIVRVRKARCLTLGEFSRKLEDAGLPLLPTGISKIEQGRRRVSIGEAVVMSAVLGCELDKMLSGDQIKLTVVVA